MGYLRASHGGVLRSLAACLLGLARADEALEAEIAEDLARMWALVAVGKASRNVPMEGVPDIRTVCQFGLGGTSLGAARWLLGEARPGVEALELHDVEDPSMQALLPPLRTAFGARLRLAPKANLSALGDPGAPPSAAASPQPPACDLAVISQNSTEFTLERLLRLTSSARYVAVAWLQVGCHDSQGNTTSSSCGFLSMFWYKTLLMRRGYCHRHVCMSRVPVDKLHDPNVFPLDCEGLTGGRGAAAARNWTSHAAEFSQDWYALWNFFARTEGGGAPELARGGLYVDVGASLGFEYSNTVALDRCLGWRGLCVEPNGGILPWVRNYRTCEVIHNCVSETADMGHVFRGRDGEFAFSANCRPLGEILTTAGLKGQRIDIMSIDVEHGELGVLRGINLEDFDIAVMIIEVSHGARWLEVETEVLQHGYAKVAVLGRDVVYARLDLLRGQLGAGELSWRRFAGTFLPGFAAGDELPRPLAAARSRCEGLGRQCGGVTCDREEGACSVRAGRQLWTSPSGEVSHTKAAAEGGGWALADDERALLPEGWEVFHGRVVQEELYLEEVRERELAQRGLRRPPAAA
mmetsp:Transcript_108696/g.317989  ORF Transcript_108696/g.317989 Transcript_108696/m.317989 type:complete len:579 (-) Transcript_108696:8-1744(-)